MFSLSNKLKRFQDDTTGSVLVEFLLVLPLFIILLLGTLQIGMLFLTWSGMYNAARETARRWAVQEFTTEVQAEADAAGRRAAAAPWVAAGNWDVTGTTKVGNQLTVSITVPSSGATMFLILPLPANLTATVAIRDEDT